MVTNPLLEPIYACNLLEFMEIAPFQPRERLDEAMRYIVHVHDHVPAGISGLVKDREMQRKLVMEIRARMMRVLITLGADPNVLDMGLSPLNFAVSACDRSLVLLLLIRGAIPVRGENPVVTAICDCPSLLDLILDWGGNLNMSEPGPLQVAVSMCNLDLVRKLLERGANPNAGKEKPLHVAVRECPRAIPILLKWGADPRIRDPSGLAPIHAMVKKCIPLSQSQDLSQFGARDPREEMCREVIGRLWWTVNERDGKGRTPLHMAVDEGDEEMIRYLLRLGADPNARDDQGLTPLHLAVLCRVKSKDGSWKDQILDSFTPKVLTGFTWFLRRWGLSALPELRDHGKDPSSEGMPSPPRICPDDLIRIVSLLLDHGTDPNVGDSQGRTPLHYALRLCRDMPEIAQLIISGGADVRAKDRDGVSPLHVASGEGCLNLVEELVRRGADVNGLEANGRTPLFWAVEKCREDVARYLIGAGADLEWRDAMGMDVREVAVVSNCEKIVI
ncbi:putative ankyrin repeat protein [Metallosphaera sp. J1]|uniref:ankyrin repeat domain-containing protein n=1 Tax=Metallosphaera javensis (ex Hofmann et al. 2022) TaxID=99938 RepID=UPI001EDF89B6|nr:ankyrin repeat domain-containing protein [Metallosphaera javensis (ex Hofmann et al. 2022)]MCG3109180.1 putative ankyrin repeat protein [Metallosphaera javensis (ex Hofmann et al. 2022)]